MPVSVDDEWRCWIAENLVLGTIPECILRTLVAHGMAESIARAELDKALASPYLDGARHLRNRLAKYAWVLDIHRKLNRLHPQRIAVERRLKLGAGEFLNDYYATNRPVIITGMMNWPALQRWSCEYLRERCGERMVEIQIGRNSDTKYEINQSTLKRLMKFADYVGLVERAGITNDFYMTANNNSHNGQALSELWDDIGPLPEYLDGSSCDRGFLWFGPAGTRTPLHHDLTNNLMAQVVGRKRVRIIPACELPYVYNQLHCYSEVDAAHIDYDRFPLMQKVQMLDCVLSPGEMLFLPVGCWHYVEALDVSITVSFTNFLWENDFSSDYQSYGDV